MLKKITIVLGVFLLQTLSQKGYSQERLSYIPETKEACISTEQNVLATINWLEATPIGTNENEWKQQSMYFMAWVTNSPTVTIELNANVITFTEGHPEFLIIFLGGWTRYSIQNNYDKDPIKGSLAGLQSVIKVYQNSPDIKDKNIEKIIKLDKQGKLEAWVKEKMQQK